MAPEWWSTHQEIVSQSFSLYLPKSRLNTKDVEHSRMSYSTDIKARNSPWYVVQCKPLKENFAAQVLRDDFALDIYVPLVVRCSGCRTRQVPLFPGSLFLRADLLDAKLSSINVTPGVVRLLEFGGVPQAVPAQVVEAIRKRVDTLNTRGGLPNHDFRPGEAVSVKSGPLRGLQAVFVGPLRPSARVRILLHFLGHLNEVQVELEVLQRAISMTSADVSASWEVDLQKDWQKRTTRGRGRRISQ